MDYFRYFGVQVQSFAGSIYICHKLVTMLQFRHNTGTGDGDFLVLLGEDIQVQVEFDLVVWYVIFASVLDQKILIKNHKHTYVIVNRTRRTIGFYYWRDWKNY